MKSFRMVLIVALATTAACSSKPKTQQKPPDFKAVMALYEKSQPIPAYLPPPRHGPGDDFPGRGVAIYNCVNKCSEEFGFALQTCFYSVGDQAGCVCRAIDTNHACNARCTGVHYLGHQCEAE